MVTECIPLSQQADVLVTGIAMRVCDRSDVVRWADDLIDRSDEPSGWMIELSLREGRDYVDIVRVLNAIPGLRDRGLSFRMAITRLAVVHPVIRQDDEGLVRRLLRLGGLPDDLMGLIYQIDHNWDTFKAGYCEWRQVEVAYQALLGCAERDMRFPGARGEHTDDAG